MSKVACSWRTAAIGIGSASVYAAGDAPLDRRRPVRLAEHERVRDSERRGLDPRLQHVVVLSGGGAHWSRLGSNLP
jgi:hypothetical protein